MKSKTLLREKLAIKKMFILLMMIIIMLMTKTEQKYAIMKINDKIGQCKLTQNTKPPHYEYKLYGNVIAFTRNYLTIGGVKEERF